ncbi:sucrase ferredoxin [Acaryochloris marina]|uniref:sucrase ferredoxin n=1 Tax=Acaryochloris marina TaxID=155978 RepID=UPI001EE6582B|nr:sucrase ferredoxin [Acaryochloris marina]
MNFIRPQLFNDCQICSVISKSNGEDPIGSAHPCDIWIMVEISLPWTEERLMTEPILRQLYQLFHDYYDADEQPFQMMPMVIAPDHNYSVPEYTRVLLFQRPAPFFAQFNKQEFLLPFEQLPHLMQTALTQPSNLKTFDCYKQPTSLTRDLFVCTHGNVDVACARFGTPVYFELRKYCGKTEGDGKFSLKSKIQNPKSFYSPPSSNSSTLRVWRCSHFGGHQFAPTLVDLPTGQVWGHLEMEMLDTLIQRHRPVTELRRFYRGWSGLPQYAQILEREVWMQQGWDWLAYNKLGHIMAQDTDHEKWDADWADVRLEFASPDGLVKGAYEARVEVTGSVLTVWNSGEKPEAVKQYSINQLICVA